MKHILTKIVSVICLIAVLAAASVLLFACNKDIEYTISDIYKSYTSAKEFTSAKLEFTLPIGYEIYLVSSSTANSAVNLNSDVGYIPELNGFVVSNNQGGETVLSIVKCGDSKVYFDGGVEGMIFPLHIGIIALRVKSGLIACKFNDGTAGVFDYNGNTVISRAKFKNNIDANTIDSVVKILDRNLVAVNSKYEISGVSGYTSIIRPTLSGAVSSRGSLVCRVENGDGNLDYVDGFDGKYVSVVGNKTGAYVYRIPDSVSGEPKNMTATINGTVVAEGYDNYKHEVTYIGKGRFYIAELWTVSSSSEYSYYDGDKYYNYTRKIYTPDDDKSVDYTGNSDKIFMDLSNNYYTKKNNVSTSEYLSDGFTYCMYGQFIVGKAAFYDQYILDEDLNVVLSLTGNFGIEIAGQKQSEVSVYDLVKMCVDGYYYTPVAPSEVNIYDSSDNRVGHNDRSKVQQMELSNNVIVASVTDPDKSSAVLYGAFNLRGEEIIDFKYLSLSAFRGAYTIGQRYDDGSNSSKSYHIIGMDGREIDAMSDGSVPLSDMALDSTQKQAVYKIGCYMFTKKIDGVEYLGVKNFNPNVDKNVVIDARMAAGSMLYAPNAAPENVFVFEKLGSGSSVAYSVYRLI